MGIYDAFNLFSNDQALTTGVELSDIIDFGLPQTPGAPNNNQLAQDIAKGKEVPIAVKVTEAFTVGTSLRVELVTADDAALTTNDVTLADSGVIVEATLVLGFDIFLLPALPIGAVGQFLGLRFTTVGTHTTGELHAGITAGLQTNLTS